MTIAIGNLFQGRCPDGDRKGDPPVGDKPTSRSRFEDELGNKQILLSVSFSIVPRTLLSCLSKG